MVTSDFAPGDVVVVPLPFTDRRASKRRPALVLSASEAFACGHSVLAMITSSDNAPWPLDTRIQDLRSAGLNAASVVRMKLFTLDNQLVIRRAGRLAESDMSNVTDSIHLLLPFLKV